MMRDEIEYVDENLGGPIPEGKKRVIKTKGSSFDAIYGKYETYRREVLNRTLERLKNDALTSNYKLTDNKVDSRTESKMENKAVAIARVEEKIKILSGEEVPIDFVDKRAIKIKKGMMSNLVYNCNNAYSIGLDKADEIFSEDEVIEEENQEQVIANEEEKMTRQIAEEVRRIMEEEKATNKTETEAEPVSVIPTSEEVNNIREAVEREFEAEIAKQVTPEEQVNVENEIHIEDKIKDEDVFTIESALDEDEVVINNPITVNKEEIRKIVDGVFDLKMAESKDAISIEDIEKEVERALANVVVKNQESRANIRKFDSEGQRRKFDYKPMTDEEIQQARENIEYDKYEKIYHERNSELSVKVPTFEDIFTSAPRTSAIENLKIKNEVPVREVPVVVPDVQDRFVNIVDKEIKEVFEPVEEEVEEFTFDAPKVPNVSSISSLSASQELISRYKQLKKQVQESENSVKTSVGLANATAERAQIARDLTNDSASNYQQTLRELELLNRTLEQKVKQNKQIANTARNDAECNERFIQAQSQKKDMYDEAAKDMKQFFQEASIFDIEDEGIKTRRAA